MKKFLLLITSLLCMQGIRAQNRNFAEHRGVDYSYSIVSINGKSFYTQNVSQNCCSDVLELCALDENFQKTWTQTFNVDETNIERRLLATSNKQIAILGYGRGCDVMNNENFFAKLDTTGSPVFQVALEPNDRLLDFTEYNNGTFYFISPSKIYNYSAMGQSLSVMPSPIPAAESIHALASGRFLVSSISQVAEIGLNGSVYKQKSVSSVYSRFAEVSGRRIVAMNLSGALHLLDSNLNILSSLQGNLGVGVYTRDFKVRNDTVFATGNRSGISQPCWALLSSSLTPLSPLAYVNYGNIVPTGIAVGRNNKARMVTWGNSNSNLFDTFSGVYEMPLTGNFNSPSDVGVTSATVISAGFHQNNFTSLYGVLDYSVTVKNFGADTVKSFVLNHYSKDFLCLVLLQRSYPVSLAPGQSISVSTGTFYVTPITTNLSGVPNSPTINVCVFTSIPNSTNDSNIFNDGACLAIPVITGLDEPVAANIDLVLFPNPCNETVKVRSDVQIARVDLFDISGRKVASEKTADPEAELNVSHLSAGVYFAEIITQKGTAVRKIVKE